MDDSRLQGLEKPEAAAVLDIVPPLNALLRQTSLGYLKDGNKKYIPGMLKKRTSLEFFAGGISLECIRKRICLECIRKRTFLECIRKRTSLKCVRKKTSLGMY